MKAIAFRVDGNKIIGIGHVMRCLSLAHEFKSREIEVIFISAENSSSEVIQRNGYEIIEIENVGVKSDKVNPEFEVGPLIEIIKTKNIETLFIDTYNVTEKYFLKLLNKVDLLCYIDDLNKFVYPVDVLIHGGIINKFRPYEKFSESELILAGTEYSLLRPEFKNLPTRKINETISEIMISSGGTDNFNVIPFLIRAFRSISSLNNIKINVIVGSSFNNKEELKSLNTKYPNIVFYENVDHISQIMLKSDVAFSAGGSTIYELMACGTPIISYVIAENQDYIIQKMQEMGCLINMGWHHELDCKSVIKTFNTLKDDYNLRLNLSNYGQQLVDARGPERVVSEILKKQNH